MGNAAAWTPDSKTLFVTDSSALNVNGVTGHTDTLYVFNVNTGWTTYPLGAPSGSNGAQNLAITVPGVGAYLTGSPTVAHTWCPSGTVGQYAGMLFYPEGDSVDVQTDVLTATTDGSHILGADYANGGITLSDIDITIPESADGTPAQCPQTGSKLSPLTISHTVTQTPVNVNATDVLQVLTSPAPTLQNSGIKPFSVSFITYDGTTPGATLPYYEQTGGPSTTAGTLNYLTLNGASAITAPVAGAFSLDSTLFFVSTAGDNKIHYISIPTNQTSAPVDSQQISPNLPACTPVSAGGKDLGCIGPLPAPGQPVPATVIVVKPRTTT
jgi:hypothetical protein